MIDEYVGSLADRDMHTYVSHGRNKEQSEGGGSAAVAKILMSNKIYKTNNI